MRKYTGEYINGFKMYMNIEDKEGVKSFSFRFPNNGTTEIEEITIEKAENNNYYDLQGRRVEKPTKGLYIVNGKKVIF